MTVDLKAAFNNLSDVVVNRPSPIRKYDQIFMKTADLLMQVEHLARWVGDRSLLAIGDGDAVCLSLAHLAKTGIVDRGPRSVLLLDFDERVVNATNDFANSNGLAGMVVAERYNVRDALPRKYVGAFDSFYTNPPFGRYNRGKSVTAFSLRCIEGLAAGGVGCVVTADSPADSRTTKAMKNVQNEILRKEFIMAAMIPRFHTYHLDDNPSLTSCSMIFRHIGINAQKESKPLPAEILGDFYGRGQPLDVEYIEDRQSSDGIDRWPFRIHKYRSEE